MVVFISGCKKDISNDSPTTNQDVAGYAQKGPFINGSSVTIYDLKADLSATGKSFNAQITDNKGSFEMSGIPLSSTYVKLRADGFYFNEVSGKQSSSQLTLYAIAAITGNSKLNINLLTHLERSRLEYLMGKGKSFSESKTQAQKEVLAIFNIDKSTIKPSENLDISESGDDNGILLTITSILQGYRSESELTELLSNISNDMKEDGTLDSDILGSALITHAVSLDTISVKNNLAKRYADIGSSSSIPYFGKHLSNFITNTKFKITQSLIDYPASGLNGENILNLSKLIINSGINHTYSLSASLPNSTSLKIKITSLTLDSAIVTVYDTVRSDTSYTIRVHTVYKPTRPTWSYFYGSGINWSITEFDFNSFTQTFTAIEPGKTCDLSIFFEKGSFLIEYFEMNATMPTRKKTITVN